MGALVDRARLRDQLDRPGEALLDFEVLAAMGDLTSAAVEIWATFAHCLLLTERFAKAEATASRAIEVDASFAQSWLYRAEARANLADWDGALADIDRLGTLDPEFGATDARAAIEQARAAAETATPAATPAATPD